MEEEKRALPPGVNPSRPIIIRDGNQPLELWPRIINGVEVYTPADEKMRELDERFRRGVAPPEPKIAWRHRLNLLFSLAIGEKQLTR